MTLLLSGSFHKDLLNSIDPSLVCYCHHFDCKINEMDVHIPSLKNKQYLILENVKILPVVDRVKFFNILQGSSIRVLVLRSMNLTNDCLRVIGDANLTLDELDLSYNKFNDLGVEFIKKYIPKLTSLLISKNPIKDGFSIIMQHLTGKLKVLNVASCNIASSTFIRFFDILETTNIKVLDISDNSVGVKAFKKLKSILPNTKLKQLSFGLVDDACLNSDLKNKPGFMEIVDRVGIINLNFNRVCLTDNLIDQIAASCNTWTSIKTISIDCGYWSLNIFQVRKLLQRWTPASSLSRFHLLNYFQVDYPIYQMILRHEEYIQKAHLICAILSASVIKRVGIQSMASTLPIDLVRVLYDFL